MCGCAAREPNVQFFGLPVDIQERVQKKIDDLGQRLRSFPHYRMEGMEGVDTYRLRVGDYRVIYQFDMTRGDLFLIALGHRREIYKQT